MIVDSMTKLEVMKLLRRDFDTEIKPFFDNSLEDALHKETQRLLSPQKNKIVLPARHKKSSQGLDYAIICTGTRTDYQCSFSTKFRWRNKIYYADLSDHESVTVYSQHAIERYAERHLKDKTMKTDDVFYKHIERNTNAAFHIVLQFPTHENCLYFGLAGALFLGDYEPKSEHENWYNTCVSLNELYESQYRIYNSLAFLCDFVNTIKFNPLPTYQFEKHTSNKDIQIYLKKNPSKTDSYIKYLRYTYMLCMLHLSFNFSYSEPEKIKAYMKKVEDELLRYNVNANELSPYDINDGIALRGELDFGG